MVKLVYRNKFSGYGFTLIETLIAVSIVCLIVPLAFQQYGSLSAHKTLRYFIDQANDLFHQAQYIAVTEKKTTMVSFYESTHTLELSIDNKVRKKISYDPRIQIIMASHNGRYIIGRNGHFSDAGKLYIKLNDTQYKFVVLIGQGRFYFEKL
ncbi:prepilin-type N-terminal cleavage/methylation domain-containing protein [Terrilactibacillus sp. BCM23-1]|uniref:Prepilin-type N-terminal cleavage/methylation domain-containing protein n=1 Tax=Terrilactibacillus tamarindi TaxID=2599694 RepID=A0A6N8CT06_9BACI|nr:type II secretion system protein [Terrilactibacillus tamarindi]MTT33191.1 prepilin-type N-terminal cleavage/methylation domain-containing protein [Terrilactibacillus tamarindi]